MSAVVSKTNILTSCFPFLCIVRTHSSEQEGFFRKTSPTCTKFKGVKKAKSTDEQPRQHGGDPEPTRGSGREGRRRGPATLVPPAPRPRRGPDQPPGIRSASCLRLLRRVPAPRSLLRAGAPLTRREGIYVAVLVTAYGREEVGTASRPPLRSGAAAQQPGAVPAAAPRCPRQL